MNDSAKTFSQGDPGIIYALLVVSLASHQSLRAWAMNSGPLSERMNVSCGYLLVSSTATAITPLAFQCLPTRIHIKRRLCPSITFNFMILQRSALASNKRSMPTLDRDIQPGLPAVLAYASA